MNQENYEAGYQPEKRPSFLTWLCILTFIGSGWAIANSIWSYFMANRTHEVFENTVAVKHDSNLTTKTDTAAFKKSSGIPERFKQSISKMVDPGNMRRAAIGGLIASIFTLIGAILMWNLIRSGFYFYIFGVLFGIVVPFYIFKNDFLAIGAASFANFFGLIFIALYALNLKSMHR